MDEIKEMDNGKLIDEYRETVEFRSIESEMGQVTPHEIDYKQALEEEIKKRMEDE